jgi:integrase
MEIGNKKRGRKPNHYITSDNKPIEGLAYDKGSGRWRVIESNRFFRAPDERAAIAKFYELTGDNTGNTKFERAEASRELHISRGNMILWARNLILDTPQLAAKTLGIEWLAYGPQLSKPAPLPSLESLRKSYETNADCEGKEKRKVKRAWDEFVSITGITSTSQIDTQRGIAWVDELKKRDFENKTLRHRISSVRRIFSFNRDRGVAKAEMSRCLAELDIKLKKIKRVTKPKPISKEHFAGLISAATNDEDKAMLYLMLNSAMYLQEVVRVKWEDIDFTKGTFATQREKEGQCLRVAVLFPETLEALNKLQRKSEYVLTAAHGMPLTVSGAGKRYRKIRKEAAKNDASIATIEANQIRDGVATAMMLAGVTKDLRNIVKGHGNGIEDAYALRDPQMVKPAMDAIHNHYLA